MNSAGGTGAMMQAAILRQAARHFAKYNGLKDREHTLELFLEDGTRLDPDDTPDDIGLGLVPSVDIVVRHKPEPRKKKTRRISSLD